MSKDDIIQELEYENEWLRKTLLEVYGSELFQEMRRLNAIIKHVLEKT